MSRSLRFAGGLISGTKALVMIGNFRRPGYSTYQIIMQLPGVSNRLVDTWLNHYTQVIRPHRWGGCGEKFLGLGRLFRKSRRHGECSRNKSRDGETLTNRNRVSMSLFRHLLKL